MRVHRERGVTCDSIGSPIREIRHPRFHSGGPITRCFQSSFDSLEFKSSATSRPLLFFLSHRKDSTTHGADCTDEMCKLTRRGGTRHLCGGM